MKSASGDAVLVELYRRETRALGKAVWAAMTNIATVSWIMPRRVQEQPRPATLVSSMMMLSTKHAGRVPSVS